MAHALALALDYNWRAAGEVLNNVGLQRLLAASRGYLGAFCNTDGNFASYRCHFFPNVERACLTLVGKPHRLH